MAFEHYELGETKVGVWLEMKVWGGERGKRVVRLGWYGCICP